MSAADRNLGCCRRGDFGSYLHATCCIVLMFFAGSCGRGNTVEDGADRHVPSVEAVQSRHGTLPLTQRFSGVVKGKNQVEIYPQIEAIITEVLVDDGGAVRKDEPLVRLRDTEFQERLKQAKANHRIALAQLRRAQAQLKEVEADFDRMRSLAQRNLASQAELETAEARREAADADVELAKARVQQTQASVEEQEENLTQTVILAPIRGRVGNRNAEVGMLANSGTRLFTLGQLDSVRVEIVLTDRMLSYIKENQPTAVSSVDLTASVRLSRISPFLHPVSHTTTAEIDMANPNERLKPGMFVTVDVYYDESEQAILVPLSALYEQPTTGAVGVYVTNASLGSGVIDELDGTAMTLTEPVSFQFVTTDVIAQSHMEVAIRGVEPNAWVVTLGQNLLGEDATQARVRPVKWERVERLQRLQREDLMRDVVEQQSSW